jgi:hypothetical protein
VDHDKQKFDVCHSFSFSDRLQLFMYANEPGTMTNSSFFVRSLRSFTSASVPSSPSAVVFAEPKKPQTSLATSSAVCSLLAVPFV